METKKISLAGRLNRLCEGEAAHPEYDGFIVQSMARMPIAKYIGNYNTFCDLQMHTEVREDLPYQETAKVITELVSAGQMKPKDKERVVKALASPIIKIQRAYDAHNPAMLPYCKPQKIASHQSRQENLASRLEHVGTIAGPPYNCNRLPIWRFFLGVWALTGDEQVMDIYLGHIQPHMRDKKTQFQEAVCKFNCYPSRERTALLYKILVEPVAALP